MKIYVTQEEMKRLFVNGMSDLNPDDWEIIVGAPETPRNLSAEAYAFSRLLREDGKVPAIKFLRKSYPGLGLKEAKAFTDSLDSIYSGSHEIDPHMFGIELTAHGIFH